MILNYYIDNNKWDEIEKEITINVINTIINNEKFLIHYCLIHRKIDLIQKILLLDENNYKKIDYNIICDILIDNDYITILHLLKLVNDEGKKYILTVNKNSEDYTIFLFMKANNKYIRLLLEYDSFINWNIEINYIALDIYLYYNYNNEDNETKEIFNILLKKSITILKNRNRTILESCLKGFNKYYLDKIYEIDNNIINKNNIILKTCNNLKLFDYLIDKGCDYNKCEYGNNILLESIKQNNLIILEKLISMDNIDCNIFDSNRNQPINYILINSYGNKYSYEFIEKILIKTNDMNFKNITGNTPMHYYFTSEWFLYLDIFKTKNVDIFIKNNKQESAYDIFKERISSFNLIYQEIEKDKLLNILSFSCINSFINQNEHEKILIKNMLKNNKYVLLKIVKKNVSVNHDNKFDKAIDIIKKNILKLKTSTIKLDYKINLKNIIKKKNIFVQRDCDIYIYIYYYLKKYNFKIPINTSTKIIETKKKDINVNNINLNNINVNNINLNTQTNIMNINLYSKLNHYYQFYNKYENLSNCIIYWDIETNEIIFPDYKNILLKMNTNIIFILIKILKNNNMFDYNCIIINNQKNIIIHFKHFYNDKNDIKLDNLLKTYFLSIYTNYNFINSFDLISYNIYLTNNLKNYYEIENGDFINPNNTIEHLNEYNIIWILWFLELYMNNINIDLHILVNKSIDKIITNYGSLLKYIRWYYNRLISFLIIFFKKINISDDSIFKLNISSSEQNIILTSINNKLSKYSK